MALQFKCPSCDKRFPVELPEAGSEKACPHCDAATALPGNPLSDGYFLGDFEILGPLGAGRDGSLYLARDANAGMDVALRVPADELTGGAANADAFLEQVVPLETFEHPNVARVLATGWIGEHCFYVMEYCGGGSLSLRRRGGRLEEAEALRIVEQLAEGLRYLHQQNFIPRDLNSSKVMFDDEGRAKWTDVALARPLFGGEESFEKWTVYGTPEYLSPEQARPRGHVDTRSNLYSLGAIAFEMLTGRPPFVKPTEMETIAAHLNEPVPDPRTYAAVSGLTAAVVMKLLAKNPDRRFQSAGELLSEFRAPTLEVPHLIPRLKAAPATAEKPIIALAPARSFSASSPPQKKGRLADVLTWVGVLLLIPALLALFYWQSHRGESLAPLLAYFKPAPVAEPSVSAEHPGLAPSHVETVRSTVAPQPAPNRWTDLDIGSPAVAGGTIEDAATGVLTVRGSGKDIWDSSDQFHFRFKEITGDGSIEARVISVENTFEWAKAGVMFRDGTATDAMFAMLIATPSQGLNFQWRNVTGKMPEIAKVAGITAPVWVRLVRAGDNFSAYYSTEGANWQQVGTPQAIKMNTPAQAGLCVTSHTNGVMNASTFDHVNLK